MIRNENTANIYETWKNSAPIIIPRKLKMKPVNGEPLSHSTERKASLTQLSNITRTNEVKNRKSSGEISEDRYQDGRDYRQESERPQKRTSQETVARRLLT